MKALIRNDDDRRRFGEALSGKEYPYTLSFVEGGSRSLEQNRVQHMWMQELAQQDAQDSHDADWYRAFCKLTIGVPIMRRDDEYFKQQYDKVFKRMTYEDKLEAVKVFDLPVTRLMNVKQKTEYLSEIYRKASERGLRLTEPRQG